jgi:hypothetical protein
MSLFTFVFEQLCCSLLDIKSFISILNKVVGDEYVRPMLKYGDQYFRVDEVCFHKPFIVIEYGTYKDVMNNTMIDAEPFPFDLSDDLLLNEVKYSLGILPYPTE